MTIYEKLLARMNTNKTRTESKESVLKIKLLHPKSMSDPSNPLFHSQMLAGHEFLLSKQLHFKSHTGMQKQKWGRQVSVPSRESFGWQTSAETWILLCLPMLTCIRLQSLYSWLHFYLTTIYPIFAINLELQIKWIRRQLREEVHCSTLHLSVSPPLSEWYCNSWLVSCKGAKGHIKVVICSCFKLSYAVSQTMTMDCDLQIKKAVL